MRLLKAGLDMTINFFDLLHYLHVSQPHSLCQNTFTFMLQIFPYCPEQWDFATNTILVFVGRPLWRTL